MLICLFGGSVPCHGSSLQLPALELIGDQGDFTLVGANRA